jgi:hypothetical protein
MKSFLAVALISVGAIVIASLALNCLTPGQRIEFAGVNLAQGDGQFIPPVAGGLVFVAGMIWLWRNKWAWLLPHNLLAAVKRRQQRSCLRDLEAERLDRIRNPSKYLGK